MHSSKVFLKVSSGDMPRNSSRTPKGFHLGIFQGTDPRHSPRIPPILPRGFYVEIHLGITRGFFM